MGSGVPPLMILEVYDSNTAPFSVKARLVRVAPENEVWVQSSVLLQLPLGQEPS